MRYDTVIFDIDGTLIDSASAIFYTLQNAVRITTGKTYEYSELQFALGLTSEEALRQLVGDDCEEACRVGRELYGEYMAHIQLFDGMEETILALADAGVKLGIVTSKTRGQFDRSFHYSVKDYFGCFICADDLTNHKPDPEPLLTCLSRLGSPKDSAFYIGDSIYDSQCAVNAGIDFGLALWGSRDPEHIPANIRLSKPSDICKATIPHMPQL